MNNLSPNILNIGQILKILYEESVDIEPNEGTPTNTYVVQYSDILFMDNNE